MSQDATPATETAIGFGFGDALGHQQRINL